jgi:epoxyqueuosine reductase
MGEPALSRETLIKARIRAMGFSKVGIARAVPLADEADHLREWLDRGYDASMSWMKRRMEERINVDRVVRGARSIISVALNYYTPFVHSDNPDAGKISRYAWGEDYHTVLGERMKVLCGWLAAEYPEEQSKWYVDTGPIMEKAWAQRAGLGWVGKHTNLITNDTGSWVFLGEIITTLELEPDAPATDHCGDCTLCIDACPTAAIVEPYVLDANLCISYLTIEHRGGVPAMVADRLDGWIFGCDVCQDVCPWNRKFAQPTGEATFLPRGGFVSPELRRWKELSEDEFEEIFADSPIRRARLEGLQRNIALCENGRNPS